MSAPMSKRRRKNVGSPFVSLRSGQPCEDSMLPWTPSQQESHRRSSAKNHPASILNGTVAVFTGDVSTGAAGSFTEDHDPSHSDIFSQGNLNSQLLCETPTIEKMSIAVDFGTENSAVTYKLHWKGQNMRPQPGKDHILQSIGKVIFLNCPKVKTQIGWHSETFQMLYGHEVDDAIRRGKLLRGSHIRGIKLTLLDPSGKTRAEKASLEKQLKALPPGVRLVQDQSGSRCRMRQLTPEDLVSEFIGYLVRHCLHQIATTTGREGLHWPRWDPQTAYRNLGPAIIAKVVLYIAVPSLATPEFVDLIVTAAQRAGFSNAIVAPEPACAQQLLLQRDFETSGGREGHPYSGASIILDVGGGTADVQTLSIVRYNPTEIREEVLGDGGLFGGRYVNSLFKDHVERQIGDQKDWLVSQLRYPGYDVTIEEILDHLEAKFEEFKPYFDVRNKYEDLELPGRPYNLNRPDRGLVGRAFRLSRDATIEIFTRQAKELIALIDNQIRLFRDRIRRIILVGGCSSCVFLRNYLEDHYTTNQAATYKINVVAPEADTTLTIAKGVLLAGFDENFVSERFLRRSYGIIWERAVEQLRDPDTPHRVEICPFDKCEIARDMAKWLLRSGQKVKREFSSALSDDYGTSEPGRAWRGIPLKRQHDKVKLTETIIYSDHVNEDDLWIREPSHKMSCHYPISDEQKLTRVHIFVWGTIEIRLTRDECRAFKVMQNPDDGRKYYYMEYEVIIRGNDWRMTYEFLIPRTGKFEGDTPGKNPIRRTAELTLAPAFQFYTRP